MTTTIGIDPGLSGAIAILRCGEFVSVFDIPTMAKGGAGKVKNEIDPTGMLRFLRANLDAKDGVKALLERVGSMPGQGVSSVFSLGDSFGCCRSVLACAAIPFITAQPAKWKKHFGLPAEKEQARALAIKLFPDAELHLKKHIDRAEALLMAKYLWETEFK